MGYGMVPFNLNVLAKFDQIWPLLGLLVNFDETRFLVLANCKLFP